MPPLDSSPSASSGLSWKRILLAASAYLALTLVMTYPLAWNLGSAVVDRGDPLLNAWILSWQSRWLTSDVTGSFLDANIFFPYDATLAYSELLLTQTLVALPLHLVGVGPIASYNVVVIVAFTTSALGAFLLASQLTGRPTAAFVAGVAFAFSPFMFDHLSHMQVLTAGGIPMALFWLIRYQESRNFSALAGFAVFYVLQVFANGYYALYLTLFAGPFVVYDVWRRGRWSEKRMWLEWAVVASVVIVVTAPILVPYVAAQTAVGLERPIGARATIVSYFATPAINRLYGELTASFQRPEANLFPGALVVVLALVGLWASRVPVGEAASDRDRWLVRASEGLILFALLYIVLVTVRLIGGSELLMLLAMGLVAAGGLARYFLSKSVPSSGGWLPRLHPPFGFVVVSMLVAFLFTFGDSGPYVFLHRYVPGFDGLRAVTRVGVVVMLGLALFASVGAARLLDGVRESRRRVACLALVALICGELASFPLPRHDVLVGDDVPDVYRWLGTQDEPFAVVEYPIEPTWEEAATRTYYSAYHWKDRVNGYSGYFPPLFLALRRLSPEFPSNATLQVLEALGVKYVLLHRTWYGNDWARVERRLSRHAERLRFVRQFDETHVFELVASDAARLAAMKELSAADALPIASIATNRNEHLLERVRDGDLTTRWEGGRQTLGQEIVVDLGDERSVGALILSLGEYRWDNPRRLIIEGSRDGETWTELWGGPTKAHSVLGRFLDPQATPLVFPLAGARARFLRLRLISRARLFWSIAELSVVAPR